MGPIVETGEDGLQLQVIVLIWGSYLDKRMCYYWQWKVSIKLHIKCCVGSISIPHGRWVTPHKGLETFLQLVLNKPTNTPATYCTTLRQTTSRVKYSLPVIHYVRSVSVNFKLPLSLLEEPWHPDWDRLTPSHQSWAQWAPWGHWRLDDGHQHSCSNLCLSTLPFVPTVPCFRHLPQCLLSIKPDWNIF